MYEREQKCKFYDYIPFRSLHNNISVLFFLKISKQNNNFFVLVKTHQMKLIECTKDNKSIKNIEDQTHKALEKLKAL